MSRIEKAFENGKAFIAFLTAGDPDLASTRKYVLEMEKAGADLIEIGIPFSDPIAEGPVIQEADLRALSGGVTTDQIFDMVAQLRKETEIPLVFMTYLNPVFHYGYNTFFARCQECGADGIIIPDLPYEEKEEVDSVASRYGITLISMIAPTSQARIERIAKEAKGFIYVVSSMGVTGMRSEIKTDLDSMLKAIKSTTDVPAAVGFGIHTPGQATDIAKKADGVIVGSAVVKLIAQHGQNADEEIFSYVKMMKDAVRKA